MLEGFGGSTQGFAKQQKTLVQTVQASSCCCCCCYLLLLRLLLVVMLLRS